METLHVRRLQARYRLVPSAARERARLDHILHGLLADALADAAAEAGLGRREELCVRRIDTAVRVPAGASDHDVARLWAEGLVDGVAHALRHADVVGYRSRTHALLDLTVSVPQGDVRRAWAWRQLGLWDARPLAGDNDAAERIVAALCAEPEALVAALVALAREDDALARLAALLAPTHWAALAETALGAAGARDPRRLTAVNDGSFGKHTDERLAWAQATGEHVVAHSELVRALRRGAARPSVSASPRSARAVSALALLEVEPAAARDVTRAESILEVMTTTLLEGASSSRTTATGDEACAPQNAEGTEPAASAAEAQTIPGADGARAEARADTHRRQAPEIHPDAPVSRETLPTASAAAEPAAEAEAPSAPVDAQPTRAWTHAGGLLFLLNVLADLELGDLLAGDEALAARPFRWSLHRLALQLAPVGADDPAALAFAGLPPDEDPPSLGEPPPTDAELERIAAFADRLVDDLRERLERADDPPFVVLDAVCRRRAEVVADPGWIDARFSVDDADPELRRAALDLDPGWLPWLGAVVVFTYV